MRTRHSLAAVSILVLVGPTVGLGAAESGPVARAESLRAHVTFLADDLLRGRDTGSVEYEIAARYVAAQFEAMGLEPAGDLGGYFQSVPLQRRTLDTKTATVQIHRGDRTTDLEWKRDFLMGGDAARDAVRVEAPVAFVGYGVVAPELGVDDYGDLDVEGKIVLFLSGAPASFPPDQRAYYSLGSVKLRAAVERGAVGILSFMTAEEAEKYPWERVAMNAGSPGMSWLQADGSPHGYFPELRGSAFFSHPAVRRLLEGSGHTLEEIFAAAAEGRLGAFDLPARVTLSRQTTHQDLQAPNVAGYLPGSDPVLGSEYVLFTAHLDHVGIGSAVDDDEIYNGAYDNAMGIAVMLEVARMFASASERPKRSVLFLAVTAEEQGLLGAEYFAAHPTVPIDKIVANVNFDMPLFLYPLADVVAYGAEHSSLAGPVARAAAACGFKVSPDPMPEEVIFIRSDQYAFVEAGIPAVFFVPGSASTDPAIDGAQRWTDFLSQHYHMPSDDLSQPVDWDSAVRFTRVNYLLASEIANTISRPTWNEGDFFGEQFAP